MHDPAAGDCRVVIVDANLMFAQVVELALTRHGYAASTLDLAAAADLQGLALLALASPLDVLLLGLDLGRLGDGVALLLPAVRAGVAVVVVTGSQLPGDRIRALEGGARCVLSKTSSLADLLETLERLISERPLLPSRV